MTTAAPLSPQDQPIMQRKSIPMLLFVLACATLDISFGPDEVKFGNMIMAGGALGAMLLAMHPLLRRPGPYRLAGVDAVYLAYLALIWLSVFWSPSFTNTAVQVTYLSILWLATTVLGREHILTLVKYVIHVAFIVACLSILLAIAAPHVAFQPHSSSGMPELRGIFHHQLRLGLYMGLALGFLILVWLNGDGRRIFSRSYLMPIYFAVLFVTMVAAAARLYSLAVILGLVVAVGLSGGRVRRWIAGLVLLGIVAVVLLYPNQLLLDPDAQGAITLSGRTRIWKKTYEMAMHQPLLGYGFPSFDSPKFDWMWGAYRPGHAHNSFIQAFFETGVIGLWLVVMLVFVHLSIAMRQANAERRYSYTLFIVTVAVFGSLFGANYASKPSELFAYTMLAIAIETRRGRRIREVLHGTGGIAQPLPQPAYRRDHDRRQREAREPVLDPDSARHRRAQRRLLPCLSDRP